MCVHVSVLVSVYIIRGILGAAPFAAMGFINYHGMTAEQFLIAWLRSEMIEPGELGFQANNYYYEALKDIIAAHEKEVYKTHDEIDQQHPENG